MVASVTTPRVRLYMDASNEGLCVLHPARRQFLRLRFDAEERRKIELCTGMDGFTINVSEQLSATLAILA